MGSGQLDIWDLTPAVWQLGLSVLIALVVWVMALRQEPEGYRIEKEVVHPLEGYRVEPEERTGGIRGNPIIWWRVYRPDGSLGKTFSSVVEETERDAREWAWKELEEVKDKKRGKR